MLFKIKHILTYPLKTKSVWLWTVVMLFCINKNIIGQTPTWLWAKEIGTKGTSRVNAAVVDPTSGDIYFTGEFIETIDFDPGEDEFLLTSTDSRFENAFILKLDGEGKFVWAKAFYTDPVFNIDYVVGYDIALDNAGDVYSTGYFKGRVDLDPGDNVFTVLQNGCNAYISKLNAQGDFLWAGSTIGPACGWSFAIDVEPEDGTMYIAGGMDNTYYFDVDPGPNILNLGNSIIPLWRQGFIAAIENSGNAMWAKGLGGPSDNIREECVDVKIDSHTGNIYTMGQFYQTCNFDPETNLNIITSKGESDIFICKYDSNGTFIWVRTFGGSSEDRGSSIAVDDEGFIYGTGFFTGIFEVDGIDEPFQSAGLTDIFIFKLDHDGIPVWVRTSGSSDKDEGCSITIDHAHKEVIIGGEFNNVVDFNMGTGKHELSSAGLTDIFVLGMDFNGEFRWVKTVGGPKEEVKPYITMNEGCVNVAGEFYSPMITLDEQLTLTHNSPFGSFSNIFLAKLEIYGSTSVKKTPSDSWTVYPNPAKNDIILKFNEVDIAKGQLSILSMQGIPVYTEFINSNNGLIRIEWPTLVPGMYFLQWEGIDHYFVTKIVKE